MPKDKDLKLRQEILNEWRAKTSVDDAVDNIREKLGRNSVTINKVEYWFKRFDKGDTSLFNTKSSMNVSVQSIANESSAKHSVDSILVVLKDKRLKSRRLVCTNDGRLAITSDRIGGSYITFYDLFHGEKKTITVPDSSVKLHRDSQFNIVENYLLANSSGDFYLFEVNYDTWEISILSSLKFDGYVEIIFDQLDKRKFLFYKSRPTSRFQIGKVNDDHIQSSVWKNIGNIPLLCTTLVGNKLRGFRNVSSLKYCEVDVDSLQQTQFDAPVAIENQVSSMVTDLYSWVDNRCYALFDTNGCTKKKLLSFNLDTRWWSDTQVSVKSVDQLFVDANEMLTLQDKQTFYRIALKKPDSLKNLTWFTILRNSNLMKSKLYEKIAHRLPYNCDLRCLFDNEDEEEATSGED